MCGALWDTELKLERSHLSVTGLIWSFLTPFLVSMFTYSCHSEYQWSVKIILYSCIIISHTLVWFFWKNRVDSFKLNQKILYVWHTLILFKESEWLLTFLFDKLSRKIAGFCSVSFCYNLAWVLTNEYSQSYVLLLKLGPRLLIMKKRLQSFDLLLSPRKLLRSGQC